MEIYDHLCGGESCLAGDTDPDGLSRIDTPNGLASEPNAGGWGRVRQGCGARNWTKAREHTPDQMRIQSSRGLQYLVCRCNTMVLPTSCRDAIASWWARPRRSEWTRRCSFVLTVEIWGIAERSDHTTPQHRFQVAMVCIQR